MTEGIPREARETLRRLHMDEPVELTSPHAHAASHALTMIQDVTEGRPSGSQRQYEALIASTQIHAFLALAQEVKNLRLAMYPTSGEST